MQEPSADEIKLNNAKISAYIWQSLLPFCQEHDIAITARQPNMDKFGLAKSLAFCGACGDEWLLRTKITLLGTGARAISADSCHILSHEDPFYGDTVLFCPLYLEKAPAPWTERFNLIALAEEVTLPLARIEDFAQFEKVWLRTRQSLL